MDTENRAAMPLTEQQRLERQERLGQKTFRGLLAKINKMLLRDDLTIEQRMELLRQASQFTRQIIKGTSKTDKTGKVGRPKAPGTGGSFA